MLFFVESLDLPPKFGRFPAFSGIRCQGANGETGQSEWPDIFLSPGRDYEHLYHVFAISRPKGN
jgi:hypothetical protein